MKKLIAIGAALFISVGLSGCTPPMPPEVRVALEEQSFQCVEGNTNLRFPASIQDIAPDFASSISSSCAGMTIAFENLSEPADLEISDTGTFECKPFLTVPVALDGAVIVINEPDISALHLDLKTASAIFDGSISKWNDAAIAALNPGLELPDTEISVFAQTQTQALEAIKQWAKNLGQSFGARLLKPSEVFTTKQAEKIQENQIGLFPYSVNIQEALTTADIVSDSKHLDAAAFTEPANLTSAATQWVAKSSDSSVSVLLNPKLKPTAPEGSDTAPVPYQAIYPVNMALCGSDNLPTRAVARFLLRQDSQGSIGASNLIQLPESVRIQSIESVSVGLPKVKIKAPAN